MKRVIRLIGSDNKGHETELRTDKETQDLFEYLNSGIEYLSSRGILRNYQNPKTSILTGNLPTTIKTPRGHIYGAFRERIYGEDMIIIDNRLSKEEKIYQITHEIIHGLFPKSSEYEVQVKSAKLLKNMAEEYNFFTSPLNYDHFRIKKFPQECYLKKILKKLIID